VKKGGLENAGLAAREWKTCECKKNLKNMDSVTERKCSNNIERESTSASYWSRFFNPPV